MADDSSDKIGVVASRLVPGSQTPSKPTCIVAGMQSSREFLSGLTLPSFNSSPWTLGPGWSSYKLASKGWVSFFPTNGSLAGSAGSATQGHSGALFDIFPTKPALPACLAWGASVFIEY